MIVIVTIFIMTITTIIVYLRNVLVYSEDHSWDELSQCNTLATRCTIVLVSVRTGMDPLDHVNNSQVFQRTSSAFRVRSSTCCTINRYGVISRDESQYHFHVRKPSHSSFSTGTRLLGRQPGGRCPISCREKDSPHSIQFDPWSPSLTCNDNLVLFPWR
jgi:hypothetical protein